MHLFLDFFAFLAICNYQPHFLPHLLDLGYSRETTHDVWAVLALLLEQTDVLPSTLLLKTYHRTVFGDYFALVLYFSVSLGRESRLRGLSFSELFSLFGWFFVWLFVWFVGFLGIVVYSFDRHISILIKHIIFGGVDRLIGW